MEGKVEARVGWEVERIRSSLVAWKPGVRFEVGGISFTVDRWEIAQPESEGGRLYFKLEEPRPEILELYWVESSESGLISTGGRVHPSSEWGASFLDWKPGPGKLEVVRWKKVKDIEIPFRIEFGWAGPISAEPGEQDDQP